MILAFSRVLRTTAALVTQKYLPPQPAFAAASHTFVQIVWIPLAQSGGLTRSSRTILYICMCFLMFSPPEGCASFDIPSVISPVGIGREAGPARTVGGRGDRGDRGQLFFYFGIFLSTGEIYTAAKTWERRCYGVGDLGSLPARPLVGIVL